MTYDNRKRQSNRNKDIWKKKEILLFFMDKMTARTHYVGDLNE